MQQTTLTAIEKSVRLMLEKNQDVIAEKLLNGVTITNETDLPMLAKMISNCLCVSTYLSVQAVLSLLEDSGVVQIDERLLAKLLIKQLSSEVQ
ncbi:MAG: hypothetical protein ACLSX5_13670 [Lachnospiraceae bacterium]